MISADVSPELRDRVAIITGGSQGIGYGIASAFIRAGAAVVITGRRPEPLQRAHDALAAAGEVDSCAGSVADAPHLVEVVERCLVRFGRIDVIVNNAARVFSGSLLATSRDDLQETFATNVMGPVTLIGEAWSRWMRDNGGAVVNISSLGAIRPRPPIDVYGLTKAALEDATRRLALELAPKVRVNAVAPGVVLTHGMDDVPDREAQVDAAGWPLGRIGLVEDIAAATLFLASRAASWITGQVFRVDGGRSIRIA